VGGVCFCFLCLVFFFFFFLFRFFCFGGFFVFGVFFSAVLPLVRRDRIYPLLSPPLLSAPCLPVNTSIFSSCLVVEIFT